MYFVDPARMDEINDIKKRIQSICEDASSNSDQGKPTLNQKHREDLNAYKVKIENFFVDADDMVLPRGTKE